MTPKHFKQIREAAGLSQQALGDILGKTARQVINYEAGAKLPKLVVERMEEINDKLL